VLQRVRSGHGVLNSGRELLLDSYAGLPDRAVLAETVLLAGCEVSSSVVLAGRDNYRVSSHVGGHEVQCSARTQTMGAYFLRGAPGDSTTVSAGGAKLGAAIGTVAGYSDYATR
jgi:hypothetical protein